MKFSDLFILVLYKALIVHAGIIPLQDTLKALSKDGLSSDKIGSLVPVEGSNPYQLPESVTTYANNWGDNYETYKYHSLMHKPTDNDESDSSRNLAGEEEVDEVDLENEFSDNTEEIDKNGDDGDSTTVLGVNTKPSGVDTQPSKYSKNALASKFVNRFYRRQLDETENDEEVDDSESDENSDRPLFDFLGNDDQNTDSDTENAEEEPERRQTGLFGDRQGRDNSEVDSDLDGNDLEDADSQPNDEDEAAGIDGFGSNLFGNGRESDSEQDENSESFEQEDVDSGVSNDGDEISMQPDDESEQDDRDGFQSGLFNHDHDNEEDRDEQMFKRQNDDNESDEDESFGRQVDPFDGEADEANEDIGLKKRQIDFFDGPDQEQDQEQDSEEDLESVDDSRQPEDFEEEDVNEGMLTRLNADYIDRPQLKVGKKIAKLSTPSFNGTMGTSNSTTFQNESCVAYPNGIRRLDINGTLQGPPPAGNGTFNRGREFANEAGMRPVSAMLGITVAFAWCTYML